MWRPGAPLPRSKCRIRQRLGSCTGPPAASSRGAEAEPGHHSARRFTLGRRPPGCQNLSVIVPLFCLMSGLRQLARNHGERQPMFICRRLCCALPRPQRWWRSAVIRSQHDADTEEPSRADLVRDRHLKKTTRAMNDHSVQPRRSTSVVSRHLGDHINTRIGANRSGEVGMDHRGFVPSCDWPNSLGTCRVARLIKARVWIALTGQHARRSGARQRHHNPSERDRHLGSIETCTNP